MVILSPLTAIWQSLLQLFPLPFPFSLLLLLPFRQIRCCKQQTNKIHQKYLRAAEIMGKGKKEKITTYISRETKRTRLERLFYEKRKK